MSAQKVILPIAFVFLIGSNHPLQSSSDVNQDLVYSMISQRVTANANFFYVYQDADSAFNQGFPSGFFGALTKIHLDTACIDDPASANGCSTDPTRLDRGRGTVMRVSFDQLLPGQFAGVNTEEPENWGANPRGVGLDLQNATSVVFDVRSPTGIRIQFGVGGCVTDFMNIGANWTQKSISLGSLKVPNSQISCTPTMNNVHILFTVVGNDQNTSNGGTILLDNIRFEPVPVQQQVALGFPVGNETFGLIPLQDKSTGRVSIPPDQVLKNLTTIYESAMIGLLLLQRGTAEDINEARMLANTFHYALHHDNHGLPLPKAPDGSSGLHNGYEGGNVALSNAQGAGAGELGDVRLAGFSAGAQLCGPSKFCLVLDGSTGGNNAFAILSLASAYKRFNEPSYLIDAETIGNWISANLTDTTNTGFGGYYLGYPDEGEPKNLIKGKSIENNADIFVALSVLGTIERQLGHNAQADEWTRRANIAGDFVMRLFEPTSGRFYAGTVPVGTPAAPGIAPATDPSLKKGDDVINTFDFLDSNTFTTLALAEAPRYHNQIDWRRPVQFVVNNFGQSVTVGGQAFQGFDIVRNPTAGPNGIAWEFTGQAIVAMRLVDRLYGQSTFEGLADQYLRQVAKAQQAAPFGDGRGLPASVLQNGDIVAPIEQCLSTPFQCIPERVGLAATAWAVFAAQGLNPLSPTPAFLLNNQLQLSAPSFSVNEAASDAVIIVTRTANSADAATVDYATSDIAGTSNCNVANGNASSRCDYLTTVGTLRFAAGQSNATIQIPIIDDGYAEGAETFTVNLSNPIGATLGGQSTASVTINDNDASTGVNPIGQPNFFVRQQYLDFLNRAPDQAGLDFWTGNITSCGSDAGCIEVKRINVSAAFFLSIEFQQTGNLVYKMYKAGFGNLPGKPVAVDRAPFMNDTRQIQSTPAQVIVGQPGWDTQLETNKQAFALAFVQRSAFQTAHAGQTADQYVASLFGNAGANPTSAETSAAMNAFSGAGGGDAGRAAALRSVAQSGSVHSKLFNEAFVLMQYFGYLQRNPYDPPETTLDYAGYNFWLGKLNSFGGDFIKAEMVKAFLASDEYRHRFGP